MNRWIRDPCSFTVVRWWHVDPTDLIIGEVSQVLSRDDLFEACIRSSQHHSSRCLGEYIGLNAAKKAVEDYLAVKVEGVPPPKGLTVEEALSSIRVEKYVDGAHQDSGKIKVYSGTFDKDGRTELECTGTQDKDDRKGFEHVMRTLDDTLNWSLKQDGTYASTIVRYAYHAWCKRR